MRRRLFRWGVLRSVRLRVPVVVVGNITVGGTGKTPLVRHLVEQLRAAGRRPGVVSRGHGGRARAPRAVRTGDPALEVGDEPLLLAADGTPVWVGNDRTAVAQALLSAHPEVDVVVSDDGLQHYRLARTVEIAVVDAVRGLGNRLPLPAGPLREPASRLRDVDAVVINGRLPNRVAAVPARFTMTLDALPARRVDDRAIRAEWSQLRAARVQAVAAIGHPERFFATLRAQGLEPRCAAFPDHHAFTRQELAFPDADAILMTEKDAVKCDAFGDARLWFVPVVARVEPPLAPLVLEELRGFEAA